MVIYLVLMLPPGSSDLPESRTGRPVAFCSVLLRMGFTYAPPVTRRAVVSYTALPTLPGMLPAVHFCCTILGVTSTGRYPASCPMKPGLSSDGTFRPAARDHLFCFTSGILAYLHGKCKCYLHLWHQLPDSAIRFLAHSVLHPTGILICQLRV